MEEVRSLVKRSGLSKDGETRSVPIKQLEFGLNMKGVKPTDGLVAMPPGGRCQPRVSHTSAAEADKELLGSIKTA